MNASVHVGDRDDEVIYARLTTLSETPIQLRLGDSLSIFLNVTEVVDLIDALVDVLAQVEAAQHHVALRTV